MVMEVNNISALQHYTSKLSTIKVFYIKYHFVAEQPIYDYG
ncbi:hypothetical protein MICAH_4940006 [Microcystis aeruginosa PCC 9809]|uniref:Uncharacterized protein n=1 Tax=Microcystis aeruginosa PCC 9809 TaxID=1160285 RepID=I4I1P1_MICAE|nr:hypothetical protein MICAH_4940006 [Microcystis aeruginosa PCC 9809]